MAYAGIDASVSQSGEYESTNNHISKRGSPYLRKALFRAAFVTSNCDPVFKAYYQKNAWRGNIIMLLSVLLLGNFVVSFMQFSKTMLPMRYSLLLINVVN